MLRWNEIHRMLSTCVPGFQFTDKLHHRWISYAGKTFRGFPLGPHGKRENYEVDARYVRQLVRFFQLDLACVKRFFRELFPSRPR